MALVDAVHWQPVKAGLLLKPVGLVQRSLHCAVFVAWTEWTLTMALPWWQH